AQRYVPKGTPGAVAVTEKSRDYYGFWFEGGKKRSIRFANCNDRDAARSRLTKHLKALGRRAEGLEADVCEGRDGKEVPLEERLEAYTDELRKRGRSERYIAEVERQARFVFAGVGAKVLGDLKAEKVHEFVFGLPRSTRTRETYQQAVCYFTAW